MAVGVGVGVGGRGVAVGAACAVASTIAFAMVCALASTVASVARSSLSLAWTVASTSRVGAEVRTGVDSGASSPHAAIATASSTHPSTSTAVCLMPVNMTLPLGQYSLSRAVGKCTGGAEQNCTTERHKMII